MSMSLRSVFLLTVGLLCSSATVNRVGADSSDDGHGSLELNENNWTKVLTGEWMILFYAPWCPACKSLEPQWKEFAKWGENSKISVASTDITISPGLTGRFMVTSLPTIFHVKDGVFRYYKMGRDKDTMVSYILENKWEQTEPISTWKSPDSIQMSLIAQFFKLSQKVRILHSTLMVEYGFPTWGSYFIFAIVTIFIGAILGLIMVFIIDQVYPPKWHFAVKKTKSGNTISDKDSEEDDLVKDELLDDQAKPSDTERTIKNRRKIRKTD